MKSKVLGRPMFKNGGGPALDVENVGIMQGFKDSEKEDEEGSEDDNEGANNRMPNSPEILMNNLRGDMRSVDARVEELADLVGPEAAMGTPTEVLALLQSMLAGPQEPVAPTETGEQPPMPQPPAPQEAMPMAQGPMPPEAMGGIGALMPPAEAPIQMRDGGLVQRFSDGSDEGGVRSTDVFYPPELVDVARRNVMNYLQQQPLSLPDLQTEVNRRTPIYQSLLGGGDKELTQAQMLFDIAQGGLNLAAGTNAEGQYVRGRQSAASRLAAAFSKVPGQMGARVSEMQKEQRQAKVAALQSAEKDIGNIREQNAKLVETQRKLFADIMKSSGTSIWGKGDWEWAVVNRPGLLSRSLQGKTSEEEENQISSAIAEFQTPIVETRIDPVTRQPYTVQRNRTMPPFLTEYMKSKGGTVPPTSPVVTSPAAPAEEGTTEGAAGTTAGIKATGVSAQAPKPLTYSPTDPTLFNLAGKGTGIINVPLAFLERVPLVGEFISAEDRVQANTFIKNAVNQLNRSVATNPRFAEGERKQIQSELGLFPSILDREEAYQNRLIGLDTLLLEMRKKAYTDGYVNTNLKPEDIASGRQKVQEIDSIRKILGVPLRVESKADFEALPAGSPYILGGKIMIKAR